MTVRHMRIFIQVYRTGNVTKAAQQMNMTQPAVTRAIREIENYYGVKLFERINHRLYNTEAGGQLYGQALHLVSAFDDLEKGLRNWDEFGILRVGATITLGNFLMPELAVSFKKMHPNLHLRVRISNGLSLQKALEDNELDVALIEGSMMPSGQLEYEVFGEDRLVLIIPPEHELLKRKTISLEELAGYSLLLREKGSAGRTFLDRTFALHGLTVVPEWESVSTQAIVKAVNAGLGISFLPEKLVKKDVDEGFVMTRPVRDESFVRKNFVVWHKNKFLTSSARDFIAECKRFGAE